MNTKHTPYFNLLEALKEGCPICFLVKKVTYESMDNFLYENINDSGVRQKIRTSRGFCNRHAWQLQKLGDGFGQAIIYSELINIILKEMEKSKESISIKKLIKRVGFGNTTKEICMFCRQEKDVEERYVSVFWKNFNDSEFNSHFKNSFGLCLPHLALALKSCTNEKSGKELIEIETTKLSALAGELKEFIRKHDYRFSKEKFEKEGNSWIRVIEKFIGK
jgi:hypothetical protein